MKVLEGRRPFFEIEVPEEMGRIGTRNLIRRATSEGEKRIIFL